MHTHCNLQLVDHKNDDGNGDGDDLPTKNKTNKLKTPQYADITPLQLLFANSKDTLICQINCIANKAHLLIILQREHVLHC